MIWRMGHAIVYLAAFLLALALIVFLAVVVAWVAMFPLALSVWFARTWRRNPRSRD